MTRRVAFLRAVNLGRRRVSMARVKELLGDEGYGDVSTYVNSGNVAFSAPGSREAIERRIEVLLRDDLGFEVETFVRTAAELRTAMALEPFRLASGDTYFVTFLKVAPSATKAKALEALSNDVDTLLVKGRDVHWRMRGTSTDSKLTSRDWAGIVGKDQSTSRNTTMLRKLVARLDG